MLKAFLKKLVLFFLFFFPALLSSLVLEVRKIWDSAPHNAFTDLIRYRDFFYCTFREGASHVPKDSTQNGRIRILRSADGLHWQSVALLLNVIYDLRDPKISIMPDGRLMVLIGGSHYVNGKLTGMLPHVSFSEDGKAFNYPQPVSIEKGVRTGYDWIWRITWDGQTGYGVVYQSDQNSVESRIKLLKTSNGINWKEVTGFDIAPAPNEASIRIDNNDNMLILLRREKSANGMLGMSFPPYLRWKWTELPYRLGGPNFIMLKNNLLCIGTRLYSSGGNKTVLYFTDNKGNIKKSIELPSGGDTSYPGMVLYRNYLWVSYYSSHEGKASIYIARIKLPGIKDLK